MGRKRKRDTSSTTAPSQNPYASPRPHGRRGKNRPDPDAPGSPAAAEFAERNPWIVAAVCAMLLLSTILAFRPALDKDFSFVNYDDNRYVYDNEHVKQGLTRDSVAWAFTSLEYDNWHPLTWLSHMLDRQIFGPESVQEHGKPWGHHLTSILIHAINVVVLFMALWWMTSALWPSLLVAILFGLHPLRAESVAWISERKDVLSGLFFLLTLWAYAAYADHSRSWARNGLVILLFIVGLTAKPMLVILPVLLVLLDYWPLERLWPRGAGCQPAAGYSRSGWAADGQSAAPSWVRILLEKAPLVVLAIASSVVTMVAQGGAMKVIDTITFRMRLENALVSYAAYIGELFYPVRLAPLYPFPEHGVPWMNMAAAALVLAAITALVVRLRTWRWLAVGWLWYLVALLPVIGLVQVGVQAMADRYTYLPQIGLYIMLAWSAEELTVNLPLRRWVWAAALVLVVPVLIQSTAAQTATWKDSETLWTSALKANPEIALAENNLGYIVQSRGQIDEAFKHYQHAVEIRPRYVESRINLGNMYLLKGQTEEALKHYRAAIEIRPDFEQSYVNLGTGLMRRGDRGDLALAEANFRTALEKDPQYVEAYWKLGDALCRQKKYEEGIAALRKAVAIAPDYYPAWQTLAENFANLGRHDEAIQCYEILLQQPATASEATQMLGYLYYVKRQPLKALQYWTSFLDSNPDSLPVLTMTAWLLASDPDPAIRNGGKSLALAQRAVKLSQVQDPRVLVALAAATAENGDFARAAQIIEQAKRLPAMPLSEASMLELQRRYQSGSRYLDGIGLLLMTPTGN